MNRDYIPEKHNYKEWFKIMWQNQYLPIGIVFLGICTAEFLKIEWCMKLMSDTDNNFFTATLLWIAPIGLTFIVMLGCIDFWRYLKGQVRLHELIIKWVKRIILTRFYKWKYVSSNPYNDIFKKDFAINRINPFGPPEHFGTNEAWRYQFKTKKK